MLCSTELVLVRHGHTAGNDSGQDVPMSGWTDLPLTEEGIHEVAAAGDRLSHEPPPAAIYASPLNRALQTARLLAGRFPSSLELQPEPGLCEIGCGRVDGLPMSKVRELYAAEWARNERQDDPDFRWPGGESYRELRERVVTVTRRIASRHAGKRVLLVTHAGVISQLVGWIMGTSPARWGLYRPSNGSITEVEWRGERARLVRFDERPEPSRAPQLGGR
jgi:broad specificity phosphatase PhoE